MVKIEGRYELVSNENLFEFLKGLGIPDESAQKVDSVRPIIEVKVNGNQYSIDSNSGFKNACVTFTLNEEFDDVMPNQMVLKSVATLEGNKIVIKSKKDDHSGGRTYEFTDSGCVVTMTSNKSPTVAKRTYKRL